MGQRTNFSLSNRF